MLVCLCWPLEDDHTVLLVEKCWYDGKIVESSQSLDTARNACLFVFVFCYGAQFSVTFWKLHKLTVKCFSNNYFIHIRIFIYVEHIYIYLFTTTVRDTVSFRRIHIYCIIRQYTVYGTAPIHKIQYSYTVLPDMVKKMRASACFRKNQ